MPAKPTTVAEYLEALPKDRRKALDQLRTLVRKIAPDAVEILESGMLMFKMGEMLCALASRKGYLALYVGNHRKAEG